MKLLASALSLLLVGLVGVWLWLDATEVEETVAGVVITGAVDPSELSGSVIDPQGSTAAQAEGGATDADSRLVGVMENAMQRLGRALATAEAGHGPTDGDGVVAGDGSTAEETDDPGEATGSTDADSSNPGSTGSSSNDAGTGAATGADGSAPSAGTSGWTGNTRPSPVQAQPIPVQPAPVFQPGLCWDDDEWEECDDDDWDDDDDDDWDDDDWDDDDWDD